MKIVFEIRRVIVLHMRSSHELLDFTRNYIVFFLTAKNESTRIGAYRPTVFLTLTPP